MGITNISTVKCTCGRTGIHCRFCGSRSTYALVRESQVRSAALGSRVTVLRCKKCQNISGDDEECSAQPEYIAPPKVVRPSESEIADAPSIENDVEETTFDGPISNSVPNSTSENDELPEGWSRGPDGKIISPVSMSDLISRIKDSAERGSSDSEEPKK